MTTAEALFSFNCHQWQPTQKSFLPAWNRQTVKTILNLFFSNPLTFLRPKKTITWRQGLQCSQSLGQIFNLIFDEQKKLKPEHIPLVSISCRPTDTGGKAKMTKFGYLWGKGLCGWVVLWCFSDRATKVALKFGRGGKRKAYRWE